MPKLTGPGLSLGASGTLGKILRYNNSKFGSWLSIAHKPAGKGTPNQLSQRKFFFDAKTAWNNLTDYDKMLYNEMAKALPLTGYNLFIKNFKENSMILNIKKNITSDQILNLADTPVELLPALPSGQIYSIVAVSARLNFVSNSYAGGSSTGLGFNLETIFCSLMDLVPLSAVETHQFFDISNSKVLDGGSVSLININDNWVNGDSDLDIYLTYQILIL